VYVTVKSQKNKKGSSHSTTHLGRRMTMHFHSLILLPFRYDQANSYVCGKRLRSPTVTHSAGFAENDSKPLFLQPHSNEAVVSADCKPPMQFKNNRGSNARSCFTAPEKVDKPDELIARGWSVLDRHGSRRPGPSGARSISLMKGFKAEESCSQCKELEPQKRVMPVARTSSCMTQRRLK
jgi:hypothetical protein